MLRDFNGDHTTMKPVAYEDLVAIRLTIVTPSLNNTFHDSADVRSTDSSRDHREPPVLTTWLLILWFFGAIHFNATLRYRR